MRSRLVVLHVTDTLGQGGAEQNLLTVLTNLPAERFRNHVAWLYDDARLLEAFRPHVSSATWLESGHGSKHIAAIAKLVSLIRTLRPDLVHAQLLRAQLVARVAAAMTRTPIVCTWQNTNYDRESLSAFAGSRTGRLFMRAADRWTGRRTRAFVAVSEYVRDHSCAELGVDRSRVTVIPNAVHPTRYAAVPAEDLRRVRQELSVREGERVLIAVGRLVGQKNQETLVAAMPAVLASRPDVTLWIAGEGPLRPALEAQVVSLGLTKRVRLLGLRRDIATLYKVADVFAFPSLFEGLPVALVEAMANGLPAVVSDIPPNREAAAGVSSVTFHSPRDVAAVSAGILGMLDRLSETRARAAASAAEVQKRFAAPALAERLGDVFSRVADADGR